MGIKENHNWEKETMGERNILWERNTSIWEQIQTADSDFF